MDTDDMGASLINSHDNALACQICHARHGGPARCWDGTQFSALREPIYRFKLLDI